MVRLYDRDAAEVVRLLVLLADALASVPGEEQMKAAGKVLRWAPKDTPADLPVEDGRPHPMAVYRLRTIAAAIDEQL